MSFDSVLADLLGGASDSHDIRATVRRCWFFDFDGYPVRLWDGQGALVAGGYSWIGTRDAAGNNRLAVDALLDGRDGASPRYTIGLPYIDADTYAALKADQALAKGRRVTCQRVIVLDGEGLRPATPLKFSHRLTMQEVEFSTGWEGRPANPAKVYGAAVICRADDAGRTRAPGGTWSATSQVERARLLGLPSDSGCSFVATNANRTYRIAGG